MAIIITLVLFKFMPRFSAYKFPNNKMFKFLDRNKLANNPINIEMEKNDSLLVPTDENDPIPHITNA